VRCFFSQFRSGFSGKSARTVQRPKGGVPEHPENRQETALRKISVFEAYGFNASKKNKAAKKLTALN